MPFPGGWGRSSAACAGPSWAGVLASTAPPCQIRRVSSVARAPYSVAPIPFPFVALARLAGSLPLGQGRESALAVLLVARLADAALVGDVVPAAVARRAVAAKKWLLALCPDRAVSGATAAVCDAIVAGDSRSVRRTLVRVTEVTAPILTAAARSELTSLAGPPRA